MRVIEPPSHLIPYGHFVRRLYTHLISALYPCPSPSGSPTAGHGNEESGYGECNGPAGTM